ncbi:hypothetical protein RZN22_13395 [Bacillaceae bacterium S4-13-58]
MSNTRNEIFNSEGIPKKYIENARRCFICDSPVVDGGTWAGSHDVHLLSICNSQQCIEDHIKWLIDVYISDGKIDIRHFETKDNFLTLVEKVYDDKSKKEIHNK